MKQLFVNKEGIISSKPNEIWEIITTPAYFEKWMLVPGRAENEETLSLGSKIRWTNEQNIDYLTGEVIEFIENQKLVIALEDISWRKTVPKGGVTYEFHLIERKDGTLVKFRLGDLSVDPNGKDWYDAYKLSDEIGSINEIVKKKKAFFSNKNFL